MGLSQGKKRARLCYYRPYVRILGDFGNSTGLGLILVSNDPFYTGPVEALIDSVTVHEQFPHDHRFPAAYAAEGAASPLVYQQS